MHRLTGRIARCVVMLAAIAGSVSVFQFDIAQADTAASQPAANAAVSSPSDPKRAKKLIALGDQLANGRGMPRDVAQAALLYQQAAELGDTVGKMRFGEALVFGRGVKVDTEKGVGLIRDAAEAQNSAAMVLLADLHMRGLLGQGERARAVGLLEEAAAKGQLVALVKLGGIYQAGDLVRADAGKAAAYYRKAIASGRADAMVALGRALVEGKLKGQGSPSEGIALLKQAQELDNENAVIVLSDSHFYGRGVRRNPKQAIELLKTASDAGNLKAGLRLVALYRDGRKRLISHNLRLATATLDGIAAKLPAAELKAERLLLRAAKPSSRAVYGELQTEFDSLPGESRSALVRRIRNTSRGLYIYLVQSELERLGIYKGAKHGSLSRGTVRAIQSHCIRYERPEICRKGPLSPRVVEVTAMAFQNDHEMAGLSKKSD
jgi:TPR repeat protein